MRFPERFLEEVKGRFRLSEVVGRSVQLKRAGREMVGLSPFNKEKTPSFYVNDDKAFFMDFSSGRNGDVFDWTMHEHGVTFPEAVERLAQEAGVPLPERDAGTEQAEHRRRHLESQLAAAQAVFQAELQRPGGQEARDYLAGRGLTPEDVARFGIGYAPNARNTMRSFLSGSAEDLVAAGLCIVPDGGGPAYDRYRRRITFPIYDAGSRLISFGARALDPAAKAKYLNGPDTELFDKGRQLYGLHWARKALSVGPGPLAVVEGYMDVIACLRAGIAACAPMGTSLTQLQIDLMWRFHPEPTLCFDADAAGRRAAGRAMDHALPKLGPGRSARFYHVTGGKDPDDVLRTMGPAALRSQFQGATPFVEAIFNREREAAPRDTPEQKAALRERLRAIVRQIPDRTLAKEYGDAFHARLESTRTARGAPAGRQPATSGALESAKALRAAPPPGRAALAYWALRDPARVETCLEQIQAQGLGHPALDALLHAVVDWLLDGGGDPEALAQHLNAAGHGALAAGLADTDGALEGRAVWARSYQALADYLDLERACAEAKGHIKTAADMSRFNDLKQRRDAAKRAL